MVVQDRINNSDPDMTFINPNPRGPFGVLLHVASLQSLALEKA